MYSSSTLVYLFSIVGAHLARPPDGATPFHTPRNGTIALCTPQLERPPAPQATCPSRRRESCGRALSSSSKRPCVALPRKTSSTPTSRSRTPPPPPLPPLLPANPLLSSYEHGSSHSDALANLQREHQPHPPSTTPPFSTLVYATNICFTPSILNHTPPTLRPHSSSLPPRSSPSAQSISHHSLH